MPSWFDQARFGMFIHWGHVSQQGWELSWPLVGGLKVFPACQDVPAATYHASARTFCPRPNSAREWMAQARRAGMRYAVFTTKHHDGFAMFPTRAADFSIAATRYGGNAISDVGAQGFARRLALDCSQARRRAISTGDNHLLRFSFSGTPATQYALYRRQGASTTLVDDVHPVPSGVTVTTAGTIDVEFTYTGEAESPDGKAYVIDVKGVEGFAARLFVDTRTLLPLMLTWMDKEPLRMTMGPGGGSVSSGGGATVVSHGGQTGGSPITAEQVEKMRQEMEQRVKDAEATRRTVEYRIFYGDYKTFAGVQMPTRIQRMIDGQAVVLYPEAKP